MATSSKGRGSSGKKKSSAGKARVISTKRKDALPRTGGVSAGRRKPVVLPPIDALPEPPVTAVAAPAPAPAPKKKAHRLHQKRPTARRKKTVVAAPAPAPVPETVEVAAPAPVAETVEVVAPAPEPVAETVEVAAPAPAPAPAPEPVADPVVAIELPATAYEEFAVTPLEAVQAEAPAVVETELEVEASAIVEELSVEPATAPNIAIGPPPIPEETRAPPPPRTTAARPAPAPRAPHHDRRSLVPVIGRLLSTLFRWTGVSGPK